MEKVIYEVVVHKQASKTVIKQAKNIQKAFNKWTTELLPKDPYKENDGIVVGAKRNNLQVYKKRFGTYRALLTIDNNQVIVEVFKLKSRGQIYKK